MNEYLMNEYGIVMGQDKTQNWNEEQHKTQNENEIMIRKQNRIKP